jgi:hypothetical protein
MELVSSRFYYYFLSVLQPINYPASTFSNNGLTDGVGVNNDLEL